MIEEGGVTHPDIAKRIAKYYCLTEEEAKELYPKDADKPKTDSARFVNRLMFAKTGEKDKEVNMYIFEQQKRLRQRKRR